MVRTLISRLDQFIVLEVQFNGQEQGLIAQFKVVVHSAHHHEDFLELKSDWITQNLTVLSGVQLLLFVGFG